MSELKSLAERLTEIRAEFAKNTSRSDTEIVALWKHYVPLWADCLGGSLTAGAVVAKDEIKYKVMQDIAVVLESQPPDGEGLLALYRPYRDGDIYEWLYGEYVESGWQRVYDDVVYTAIQDPGVNIYSPDLVPAIWEVTN